MTKQFSNYSDLLTFTRASKGHALRKATYGTNLVLNGTFGSNTNNWTAGGSADLLSFGKQLRVENPSSPNFGYAVQGVTTEIGAIYRLSVDFNYIDANGLIRVGTTIGGDQILTQSLGSSNEGTHWFNFVATSATTYIRVGLSVNTANVEARFDNIALQKITLDQPDGTLTLFEHPNNVPRVEYDGSGNRLGLLVEESRSNLVRYSDFNLGWDDAASDVRTFNAGTAPDGTNTATQFECTAGGFLYDAITVTASTNYTFSWYTKAGTATAHIYAFYDESNGAFVEQTQYTLTDGENVGNGWYRQSKTVTTPAGCTSIRIYPLRANDSNGTVAGALGSTLIWGAQMEAGSFPTSYIETTGSTATRSADVASIPVADFGYNQSEGTLITTVETFDADYGSYVWTINGADDTFAYTHASGAWRIAGAGGTVAYVGSLPSDDFFKLGYAFDESGSAALADGGSVTSPSHSQPTEAQTLHIGSTANSGAQLNGHIKSIKYYPRRLTNAQLQEITS